MKSRMGTVRNIKIIFLISLFLLESLFILVSIPASSGGISAWPATLTITMPEDFPEKEIQYKILVNNLYEHDINISAKIENPISYRLGEDYTFIPDLSWVKIKLNIVHLSAKQSTFLEVLIDIPDKEKPLHYNERWEVWIIVSEIKDELSGTTAITTELGIKLFIHTPERAKMQMPGLLPIFFIIVVFMVVLAVFILYVEKRTFHKKKPAAFYFKKKKGNDPRNNKH